MLERFRGVVIAVHDAHAQGVVHRDIKPNNITIDHNGRPFLVDLGICAYDGPDVGITHAMEALGNRSFAAPECEPGNPETVGAPADIYSLGKVLYWMTSGKKLMHRENFDPAALIIEEPLVRQYVSVLIDHTVRENPSARWSVTELLAQVDWALAKVAEHDAIRDTGLVVLTDGFGPNGQCYQSSSRSATTPPRGNPPADHDVAEAFFVREPVTLYRIDIGVNLRHGSGEIEVLVVEGDLEGPSENIVEQWAITVEQPHDPHVVELASTSHPRLGPGEVYWVILSASHEDSEMAWLSAAIELEPCLSRFAERDVPNDWQLGLSIRGPGQSLRVLARPDQH